MLNSFYDYNGNAVAGGEKKPERERRGQINPNYPGILILRNRESRLRASRRMDTPLGIHLCRGEYQRSPNI